MITQFMSYVSISFDEIVGEMEGEMEGVIQAVSVERTDESQVDSAVSNRDDEVIGFLLQVSFQLFLFEVQIATYILDDLFGVINAKLRAK